MYTRTAKNAGFMSAESIYSLAFYIVMVAAIAGVGATVLGKSDAAKATSAISILRANYIAEGGVLGYSPIPALPAVGDAGALTMVRLSGGLLQATGAADAKVATLPGGGTVAIALRAGTPATATPLTGFSINIMGITKPDVCSAVVGTGFGTWNAVASTRSATALPASGSAITDVTSKTTWKTTCNAAGTGTARVNLIMASN